MVEESSPQAGSFSFNSSATRIQPSNAGSPARTGSVFSGFNNNMEANLDFRKGQTQMFLRKHNNYDMVRA